VRLLERMVEAGARPPLEAMEELIRLGRGDAGAREEIMAATIGCSTSSGTTASRRAGWR